MRNTIFSARDASASENHQHNDANDDIDNLDLRLPEARVQELAADLVAALHYLHSHRILHRFFVTNHSLLVGD